MKLEGAVPASPQVCLWWVGGAGPGAIVSDSGPSGERLETALADLGADMPIDLAPCSATTVVLDAVGAADR